MKKERIHLGWASVDVERYAVQGKDGRWYIRQQSNRAGDQGYTIAIVKTREEVEKYRIR